MDVVVGIIGLGFVGGSIEKSFHKKNINLRTYDKYKKIGSLEECLESDLLFVCLPTQFDENLNQYNKQSIHDICEVLHENSFLGVVIIKSTIEPGTTNYLSKKYNLKFIHNPEFLTARTAAEDFHNQKHIVLGKSDSLDDDIVYKVRDFYHQHYPDAEISLCSSLESESMKLFSNCFYAVKIQFFNEVYQLCKKNGSDYNLVVEMMIKNGWINPMHTKVPGTDGKLSYGGLCFPKDTKALLYVLKKQKLPHAVLQATIEERGMMRKDSSNIIQEYLNFSLNEKAKTT